MPSEPEEDVVTESELLRIRAHTLASQRQVCFRKAAHAFEAGDHSLARQLSSKGKALGEEMGALNSHASSLIFTVNNKGRDTCETIDLHGLHVSEARETLSETLAAHAHERRCWNDTNKGAYPYRMLKVITGRGRHSRDGTARIKLMVEQYLAHNKYHFTLAAGTITVTLR